MTDDKPLMQFTSHISGKNARVKLWPDRVEWDQEGKVSIGKVMMLGMAGGFRKRGSNDIIMIRSVTGVTMRRSSLLNNEVVVSTPAGTVEFRCSPGEAETFRRQLLALIG